MADVAGQHFHESWMTPLKIFFIGRKSGIIAYNNYPWKWHQIENRRQREEKAFEQVESLVRTYDLEEADILYVRNRPERTGKRVYRRILRKLDRYREGRYVVNDPRAFPTYQCKDAAFECWQAAGLDTPAWRNQHRNRRQK